MSTPQDGLSNVIADVSFNIAAQVLTAISRFQVGPVGATAGVNGVGIVRTGLGVVDVAIDVGKGEGPVTVASSLQAEFSVATTGPVTAGGTDGTVPMSWTVTEKTAATASNPNIRIYTFHFFSHDLTAAIAGGSVVAADDPSQCTITIRRKKELLPV